MVSVSLGVRQRDFGRALAHVLDPLDVTILQIAGCCIAEAIGHNDINWRLRAQSTTIGVLTFR